jgi:hypothetical protein
MLAGSSAHRSALLHRRRQPHQGRVVRPRLLSVVRTWPRSTASRECPHSGSSGLVTVVTAGYPQPVTADPIRARLALKRRGRQPEPEPTPAPQIVTQGVRSMPPRPRDKRTPDDILRDAIIELKGRPRWVRLDP